MNFFKKIINKLSAFIRAEDYVESYEEDDNGEMRREIRYNTLITVFKPEKGQIITEEIVKGILTHHVAILNTENLDNSEAQRLIDYVSGATFAIRGTMEQVQERLFVFAPERVKIAGQVIKQKKKK